MSQYNNIFISREDFLDYKTKGIPYIGFVIGEGYAFVQYQDYYEDTDGTVFPYKKSNLDGWSNII